MERRMASAEFLLSAVQVLLDEAQHGFEQGLARIVVLVH